MPSNETRPIRAGVIGATGYGGAETVRLLLGHPNVDLVLVTSETYAGQPLSAALPHLSGFSDLTLQSVNVDSAVRECDVLFLAWQPGRAMAAAPALLKAGVRAIDLSADFRLKSASLYEKIYGKPHTAPELLDEAVYALPELFGEQLASARLAACPGCYPTAALLALAPLIAADALDPADVIVNAASGVSGAGRSKFELGYHFPEMDENYRPYNVTGHRHRPEIEQQMAALGARDPNIVFAPHLAPMIRGILATVYVRFAKPMDADSLQSIYADYYAGKPFVRVLPPGQLPATKPVSGTNMAHLAATVDPPTGRGIIMSAIDNLVRGTAGQAVQSMNLMFGLPETVGLLLPGPYP